MAKARMIGMRKRYIPNAKADIPHRKKRYQHDRQSQEMKDLERKKQEVHRC